jgi:hypothetical protein
MHIPPLAEKRCEWTDNEGRAAIRLRRATFLLAAYGLEGDAVRVVEGDGVRSIDEALLVEALDRMSASL